MVKEDPDFVSEKTGFAIGGVPPTGHAGLVEVYIDADLMQFEEIRAAAGTPGDPHKITGGTVISVT